jgi:hypothetical protein
MIELDFSLSTEVRLEMLAYEVDEILTGKSAVKCHDMAAVAHNVANSSVWVVDNIPCWDDDSGFCWGCQAMNRIHQRAMNRIQQRKA